VSLADVEVIKLLQQSTSIHDGLDRLRDGWRHEAFIHGDFCWENCILSSLPASLNAPRIQLVDWERASGGDPCFDLGAAIAEYLRCWLWSMTVQPTADAERLARSATRPLEAMRSEVAALWNAYVHVRGLDLAGGRRILARTIDYAAVRLVAAAFEQTHEVQRPSAAAVLAVQVAENLLTWRWEASARMVGIEP
jgi:aminoglycoside phosphotransferase (APT) family kinase protein